MLAVTYLATLLVSCTPIQERQAGEVVLTVIEATPGPTATPVICTETPEGPRITALPLSDRIVRIDITGLLIGESPHFIFTQHSITHSRISEAYSGPTSTDGTYSYTESALAPIPGVRENRWQLQVIHARGVYCDEFVLPMQ
jgi:hypothetical protein